MSILDKEITVGQAVIMSLFAVAVAGSVFSHVSYQNGLAQGQDEAYERGVSATEARFSDLFERSEPTITFRREAGLNRSIGISWESHSLSYGCFFSGRDQVTTGNLTWDYVNSTKCRFINGDVSEKWNDPDYEDRPVNVTQ